MRPYKFRFILILVIISFFSNCGYYYNRTNFDYDIPTPEIYNYLDKTVCFYPAPGVDPSFIEPWFHKPALTYCKPQFKSIEFASDRENAGNIEADFYIQISIKATHEMGAHFTEVDYTQAKIETRCYDSNWKLLSKSTTYGRGNTKKLRSPEAAEEAIHKAWNNVAKKLATELSEYKN